LGGVVPGPNTHRPAMMACGAIAFRTHLRGPGDVLSGGRIPLRGAPESGFSSDTIAVTIGWHWYLYTIDPADGWLYPTGR
jgi:hypothetical protein